MANVCEGMKHMPTSEKEVKMHLNTCCGCLGDYFLFPFRSIANHFASATTFSTTDTTSIADTPYGSSCASV
jgi:hypothetical protein